MIAVIQRVLSASVKIENQIRSQIENGLLILIGIEETDNDDDGEWLSNKIINLRIFNDVAGVMNLSIKDIASTKKGNRPSYIKAAKPEIAIPIYERFLKQVESTLDKKIQTGEFGADMKVSLVNDGPVTIIIDTKNKN